MKPSGRKYGGRICNPIRRVYSEMKRNGEIGINIQKFTDLLNTVADVYWEKIYDGHHVAVPFLFNMEVVPNRRKWAGGIDWQRTKKLWEEDKEAEKDKLLVRFSPTRNFLRVRHSTISPFPKLRYLPLMLEVRPSKVKVRAIETEYRL